MALLEPADYYADREVEHSAQGDIHLDVPFFVTSGEEPPRGARKRPEVAIRPPLAAPAVVCSYTCGFTAQPPGTSGYSHAFRLVAPIRSIAGRSSSTRSLRGPTWRLADVEPADVRDLFGEMRRAGATTSAIKKLRAALSAMFATAVEDGHLRANPVQGVRVPSAAGDQGQPGEDGRAKALTRAEMTLLLDALPEQWQLFFEFLAHTGLRISEAVGLTWAHIDLGESPRVRVREQYYKGERRKLKSNNGRRDLPLSPGMAARLLAHRRDAYSGQDRPVFASSAGTELLPSNVYRRVLVPAAMSVGLVVAVEGRDEPRSAVSFHSFRHTCASLLFAEGRNVKQVQEWLGHADPGFTLRTYVHLLDEGLGDAGFFDDAVTSDRARVSTRTL